MIRALAFSALVFLAACETTKQAQEGVLSPGFRPVHTGTIVGPLMGFPL